VAAEIDAMIGDRLDDLTFTRLVDTIVAHLMVDA
jgi:hypothetical protein